MSETILFFGNERLATGVSTSAPVLQSLINNGYNVAAVIANYEAGQSRHQRELEVTKVAEAHNIPLLLPNKLLDIKSQLESYRAIAAILIAYGKIIPQEIIEFFPRGIINVHPSLLPHHRGPTPIESAILQGDRKTGVSIMQLTKAMDAGPVYGQSELILTGTETKVSLAADLLDIGQAMLSELLPGILNGEIAALPQDDTRATYDRLISKSDGLIDWHKPAAQLEREIRAFLEWPKSRTTLHGTEVTISKAALVTEQGVAGQIKAATKELIVYTGDQALQILELKPAGKSTMSAQAFLAGYRKKA